MRISNIPKIQNFRFIFKIIEYSRQKKDKTSYVKNENYKYPKNSEYTLDFQLEFSLYMF